jgi:hypothetical protein
MRTTDPVAKTEGTVDEALQVKVAIQNDQHVTVTVVEQLYRRANQEITEDSAEFAQPDSHTIHFLSRFPPKKNPD